MTTIYEVAFRADTSSLKGAIDYIDQLSNKIPGLNQVVKNTNAIFNSNASAAMKFGAALGGTAAAAAALTIALGALVGAAALSFQATIDEMGDLGDRFGYAATQIYVMKRSLEDAGLPFESTVKLATSLSAKMLRSGDDAKGFGAAFKSLGVETTKANGELRASQDVLNDLSKFVLENKLNTEQAGAATRLLGDDYISAAKGNQKMQEAIALANEFMQAGIGISDQSTKAAEDFERANQDLSIVFADMGSQLVEHVIPALTGMVEWFVASYKEGSTVKATFDVLIVVLDVFMFAVKGIIISLAGFAEALDFVGKGAAALGAILSTTFVNIYDGIKSFVTAAGTALEKLFSGDIPGAMASMSKGWDGFKIAGQRTVNDTQNILGYLSDDMVAAGGRLSKLRTALEADVKPRTFTPKEPTGPSAGGRPLRTGSGSKKKKEKEDDDFNMKAVEDYVRSIRDQINAIDQATKAIDLKQNASKRMSEQLKLETQFEDALAKINGDKANALQAYNLIVDEQVIAQKKLIEVQKERDLATNNKLINDYVKNEEQLVTNITRYTEQLTLTNDQRRLQADLLALELDTKKQLDALDITSQDYARTKNELLQKEIELKERIISADQKRVETERSGYAGMLAGLKQYSEDGSKTFDKMKSWTVSSIDSMADAMAKFVTGGKVDFASLAQSIIADLIKIQMQELLTKTFSSIGGSFFGAAAPVVEGAFTPVFGTGGYINGSSATKFSSGGYVDRATPFMFGNNLGVLGEAGGEFIIPEKMMQHLAPAGAGGGNIITVNVTVPPGENADATALKVAAKTKEEVIKLVDNRLTYHRSPGGLLNPMKAYGGR